MRSQSTAGPVGTRASWLAIGAVAFVAALAWVGLLTVGAMGDGSGAGMAMEGAQDEPRMAIGLGGASIWLAAWAVMMTAMMLPTALPLVLAYGRMDRRGRGTLLLGAGYLVAWVGVGLAAFGLDLALPEPSAPAIGAVLLLAGAYQLSPAKDACLRRCRSPFDFLVMRWRRGRLGALRLGAEHGAYCIGCCWGLMAVLVVAASMELVWVAVIALAVAAEKLLPRGRLFAKLGGLTLAVLGVVVIAT
jgi:predicted metal-binding membrane protein